MVGEKPGSSLTLISRWKSKHMKDSTLLLIWVVSMSAMLFVTYQLVTGGSLF